MSLNEKSGDFTYQKRDLEKKQAQAIFDLENLIQYPLKLTEFFDDELDGFGIFNNKVIYLGITSLQNKELPESIIQLTDLQNLNLKMNGFRNIPPQIFHFKQLKKLILCDNKLEYLPKEISELSNLEYLNVDNNNITEIPWELRNLKKLKYLYFTMNPLYEYIEDLLKEVQFSDGDPQSTSLLLEKLNTMFEQSSNWTIESLVDKIKKNEKLGYIDIFHPDLYKYRDLLQNFIQNNPSELGERLLSLIDERYKVFLSNQFRLNL